MDDKYISIGGIDYYPHSNQFYLMRCPKCKRENYALNVPYGICTWCGYNANTDEELKNKVKEYNNEKAIKETNAKHTA